MLLFKRNKSIHLPPSKICISIFFLLLIKWNTSVTFFSFFQTFIFFYLLPSFIFMWRRSQIYFWLSVFEKVITYFGSLLFLPKSFFSDIWRHNQIIWAVILMVFNDNLKLYLNPWCYQYYNIPYTWIYFNHQHQQKFTSNLTNSMW